MTDEGEDILEEIKARRKTCLEEQASGNGHDIAKNTKEAIDLKKAEGDIRIALTKATEGSKEVAGKHLAKAGAVYLLILVLSFIYSVQTLPNEAVAVVAGLITLVVTTLGSILKGIVETKEQKDPIELMHDIAEKNSEVCEREMRHQAEVSKMQHEAMVAASERQSVAISTAAERQTSAMMEASSKSHSEMVAMLKDALEKQPTSLSIRPDDVVIKQGDNTVRTSSQGDGSTK